jgi:LemA protein
MDLGVVITLVVVGLIIVWGVGAYNGLVKARNRIDSAWGQIDVQLQRRHDLVPNLVETVKGYAAHEQETLQQVIDARNRAVAAQGPAALASAERQLGGALANVFALAEAYPDLEANASFTQLQEQLAETEDKVAIARQIYNDTVLTYNNRVQTLPSSVIASATGMEPREYYDAAEGTEAAPGVAF